MNTLKNVDEKLFSAFKQSDYVIGFLVGNISATLQNPKASQKLHSALTVAAVRDLSKIEAFAYVYKEEILARAKAYSTSLTKIEYETLDELYHALEKELKGEGFGNSISEMFSGLEKVSLKKLVN
ncbi:hypothetical protein MOA67_gp021 [Klebsiella phage KpLz-2_45]|uniref:hypothetical protein n=1 Tax=Klebsiella phage KpLz-2_45 TaxID=2698923 RepID=UPI001F14480F|nr:hypothetical protein MOA67_gp021 [Klebsiella phage KpLz-2_45]UKS71887.1 hypothetical protein KpLz245_0210 [Klebsiella phage KpLz-2_45]